MKNLIFLLVFAATFLVAQPQKTILFTDVLGIDPPINSTVNRAEIFDGTTWQTTDDSITQTLRLSLDGRNIEINLDYEGQIWSKSIGRDLYFFADRSLARSAKRPNKDGSWTYSISDTRNSLTPYAYSLRIGGHRLFFTPTAAYIDGQRVKKYNTGLYLVVHDFFTNAMKNGQM